MVLPREKRCYCMHVGSGAGMCKVVFLDASMFGGFPQKEELDETSATYWSNTAPISNGE